jgi:hypothetical protein
MRFPLITGGGMFAGRERYDYTREATNALTGEGGYTADESSLYRRTLAVNSRLKARVSLTVDRLLANIFPSGTQKGELMPFWEQSLRIPVNTAGSSEERRAAIAEVHADRGAVTGIAIAAKVATKISAGLGVTVFYRFNTAAALDANGSSRKLIFQFAVEVPVAAIQTLQQHTALKRLLQKYKPAHTNGAVTRTVFRGFLTDDQLSLTDRDVLRI